MEVLYSRCAGLDVHKDTVVACLGTMVDGTARREVRTFKTTTKAVLELSEWLASEGCTDIVMEATGVYWKPVWHILGDGGFELLLANAAAPVKHAPGPRPLRLSHDCGTSCESPDFPNRCPDHSQHRMSRHGRGGAWAVRRQTSGRCGQRAAGVDAERTHAVPAATGERPQPVRAVRPLCGQSGGDDAGDAGEHRPAHRPARRRAACAGDHGHHRPALRHPRGQQARLRPRRQRHLSRSVPASGAGGRCRPWRCDRAGRLRGAEPHRGQGQRPQDAGGGREGVASLAARRRDRRGSAHGGGGDHHGERPRERHLRSVRAAAGACGSAVPLGASARHDDGRAAAGALCGPARTGPRDDRGAAEARADGARGHGGTALRCDRTAPPGGRAAANRPRRWRSGWSM